jgi:hypothetical protein
MKGIGSSPSPAALVASCRSRAVFLSARYGEMKEVNAIVDESANNFATCEHFSWPYPGNGANYCFFFTSPILLMFSFLSRSENPRSLFNPKRTLSPSSRYAEYPKCNKCCSSAVAMVDLPDADKPVNQIVKPRCFLSWLRSRRVRPGCHVIFLQYIRTYSRYKWAT